MVDHLALRVDPTQARTGVNTVQVPAGTCWRTIRVDCAFRSACNVWISKIVLDASAGGSSVAVFAQGVLTARRRIAWIRTLGWDYRCWNYKHSCSNMLYDIHWWAVIFKTQHSCIYSMQSINQSICWLLQGCQIKQKFWDAKFSTKKIFKQYYGIFNKCNNLVLWGLLC